MTAGYKEVSNSIDWSALLVESRRIRGEIGKGQHKDFAGAFFDLFISNLSLVRQQLNEYAEVIKEASSVSSESTKKNLDVIKALVLKTRNALRFSISCLSIEDDEQLRRTIQQDAIAKGEWHIPLIQILSLRKGDAKCRLMSARLLSNLTVANGSPVNAMKVVSQVPRLVPSEESISQRLLQTFDDDDASKKDDANQTPENQYDIDMEPNWMDMMLNCSKTNNREALGAIIACIHNCLCSLSSQTISKEPKSSNSILDGDKSVTQKITFSDRRFYFGQEIASSSLFVATLLRQVITSKSIETELKLSGMEEENGTDKEGTLADEATEWILHLINKLCLLGLFPNVYKAISSKSNEVLPEQIVLLHCMRSEIEKTPTGKSSNKCQSLGGDAGKEEVIRSHILLAQIYSDLRCRTDASISSPSNSSLSISAQETVLEILATTLTEDNEMSSSIRQKIGTETNLLPDLIIDLGELLDMIHEKNEGVQSRDFVFPSNLQTIFISALQVVGNLCFRCRHNQDLLRLTHVPRKHVQSTSEKRNGLHILLSTTSFSFACFTLREWAVLAIRHALDGNEANQAIVAELEAQIAVQSAELNQMGIRVNLDSAKGKVSLTPLDSVKEEERQGSCEPD